MSQPAASRSFAKLRKIIDDPLMVKRAKEMAATARAGTLASPLAR